MKVAFDRKHVIGLGALALVAVWIPSAIAATPEERAKCEAMVKQMGAPPPHDHGMDKGQGPSSMTTEHRRCQEILAEGQKKGAEKSDHK